MPLSNPGSLTDQQAYDVSAYINAHPRPDSPGKEQDWPAEGVPYNVPYATRGHAAYRPPARLIARRNPSGAVVAPPRSIIAHPARTATTAGRGGTP